MRFYVRKRRQAPAVIIVALIDILIVLLIFLMVTTTFKQQPALKLALPESSQAQKTGANETPPLIVSIDPKGNLRLGADATPVTVERLKEELLAAVAKTPTSNWPSAPTRTPRSARSIKVMDAAKEAKIKTGQRLHQRARQTLSHYFINSSAIWTALRAAPLRSWSPLTQKQRPLSSAQSLRRRPTAQLYLSDW